MAARGARNRGKGNAPLKQRARSFAFEGFPEKDRFGVFDPALRGWFVFAFMLAAAFAAIGVLDAMGRTGAAYGTALVIFIAFFVGGALAYRRIWRRPAERELLLRMAAEDDESQALRARLAKERLHSPAQKALRAAGGEGAQQEQ